jgi:hypothetical protein
MQASGEGQGEYYCRLRQLRGSDGASEKFECQSMEYECYGPQEGHLSPLDNQVQVLYPRYQEQCGMRIALSRVEMRCLPSEEETDQHRHHDACSGAAPDPCTIMRQSVTGRDARARGHADTGDNPDTSIVEIVTADAKALGSAAVETATIPSRERLWHAHQVLPGNEGDRLHGAGGIDI